MKPNNFLLDNREKLGKIFPDLAGEFAKLEAKCISCKKQFVLMQIVSKINQIIRKGVPEEFAALNPPPLFYSEKSRHQRVNTEVLVRPSCIDCVRKHLAQASVLLAEVEQGYTPDKGHPHFWLAVGHLAEASDEAASEDSMLANRIRAIRLKLTGQVNNE